MTRAQLLTAVGLSCLIAAIVASSRRSTAQDLPDRGRVPRASCATVAPNATLTLRAGDVGVSSISPGTSYGTAACDRYVVDIAVGPDASTVPECFSAQIEVDGSDAETSLETSIGPLHTPDACNTWSEEVTVYHRHSSDIAFRAWSSYTRRGAWHEFSGGLWGCLLSTTPLRLLYLTRVTYHPERSGIDTYRVAVKASSSGARRVVRARVQHSSIQCAGVDPGGGTYSGDLGQ